MKRTTFGLSALVSLALTGSAATALAATLDLTGIGYVQYGDAQSYSLPVAGIQVGESGPGSQFYVNSTPGAIKDLIVVATGASGANVTTNIAGIEGAYATPSGVSGSTFFSTGGGAGQAGMTGSITTQFASTWDANLASLQNFLAGQQMIFFFNNNQTKSLGTAAESLAAWARISITNPLGVVIGTFDLVNGCGPVGPLCPNNGPPNPYALVTQGGGGAFLGDVTNYTSPAFGQAPGVYAGPFTGTNASTDYVLSGGSICVATGGAFPLPTPVPCGTDPGDIGADAVSAPIDHNLGANQAAYAIFAPELQLLMESIFANDPDNLGGYTLHVDLRFGCQPGTPAEDCVAEPHGRSLNNGYEQVFIGTGTTIIQVPEPGTLALLGLGLLGLFGIGTRLRRAS